MLQSVEKALDLVAIGVQVGVYLPLFFAIPTRGYHRLRLAGFNVGYKRVTIVALVGDYRFHLMRLDQRLNLGNVGALARRQHKAQRVTQGIDGRVELRRKPTAGAA